MPLASARPCWVIPSTCPAAWPAPRPCRALGGYQLHAHRLVLPRPEGTWLELEAPLPPALELEPGG